jgi:cold-inducible RNA-binding protein
MTMTATTKLYVGNLARDASEEALRAHFGACGGVSDVEILTDRRSGEPRGLAFVTMTSPFYANAAVTRLDGSTFAGRTLRVSYGPLREIAEPTVKIAQQFREAKNMAYELDCAGTLLVVRLFPPETDDRGPWRLEASTGQGGAPPLRATAETRAAALAEVAEGWRAEAVAGTLPAVDWDAVARALTSVRGI